MYELMEQERVTLILCQACLEAEASERETGEADTLHVPAPLDWSPFDTWIKTKARAGALCGVGGITRLITLSFRSVDLKWFDH